MSANPNAPDPDLLLQLDIGAEALIRLYAKEGITAIVIVHMPDLITVRCVGAKDVIPLCRRVIAEYDFPVDRILN